MNGGKTYLLQRDCLEEFSNLIQLAVLHVIDEWSALNSIHWLKHEALSGIIDHNNWGQVASQKTEVFHENTVTYTAMVSEQAGSEQAIRIDQIEHWIGVLDDEFWDKTTYNIHASSVSHDLVEFAHSLNELDSSRTHIYIHII